MTGKDSIRDVRKKFDAADCCIELIDGGAVRVSERFLKVLDFKLEFKPGQNGIIAYIFDDGVLIIKNEFTNIALCLSEKYYTKIEVRDIK